MALLLEGDAEAASSLPGKVLHRGGVLGLLAFLALVALIAVAVFGQRDLVAGQTAIKTSQVEIQAAIKKQNDDNESDRKASRQLWYSMCRSLAKLSKSDPELCEVGR